METIKTIHKIGDDEITIVLSPCCFRLTYGEEVYVFDLEGRPVFMYFDRQLYERGLSGEIVAKKWISVTPPRRHLVRIRDRDVKERILRHSFERVRWMLEETGFDHPDPVVKRVYRGDIQRLWMEESVFRRIYRPISILPPDQYLSLVFQPLEGCPYNKCSFCTFYRDREFRFKGLEEFRRHVEEVVNFLGRGISMRHRIFLADANTLFADTRLLRSYIETVLDYIPRHDIEGFYSFSDYFTVYKTEEELGMLRNLGYKRVYIGLETGDPEVLRILSKPGPPERSVNLVKRLKAAGINVGVIILIGAGGREYYRQHVENTVKILNSMPLDRRDIIYFSKLKVREGSEYQRIAEEMGLTSLSDEEMDRQIEEIKQGLRHVEPPIQAIYDIDETIY